MGNELEMNVWRDYDLIPYSSVLYEDGADCGNGCAPLQLAIAPEGEDSTMLTWWIKNRETPKKLIMGARQAPVLVPFWFPFGSLLGIDT